MWAVVVAVFLLGTIRNALTLNDVSDEVLTIVTGSLLLLSVLGPSLASRIAPRLRRPVPSVQPIEGGS
jgi:rhamnose transport system permease protein